ncbi:MAG TPA: SAF domain-containing protein [Aquihabitans sp.]|nr:SAF domain-containing protein [Aquihabitans sp.]
MTVGRSRHRIARSRVPRRLRLLLDPAALRHWLLVLALAALVAGIVARSLGAAERARQAWGSTAPVVVAARDLEPGEALDAGALQTVRWPTALRPAAALRAPPADGTTAGVALAAGMPIDAAQTRSPERLDHLRTVAIPIDGAALPVRMGDEVDVWAVEDLGAPVDGAASARRVASDAEVISRSDGAVVLALDADDVEATAAAAATAVVVLVGSA